MLVNWAYVERDTIIHRIDPRARIVFMLCALFAVGFVPGRGNRNRLVGRTPGAGFPGDIFLANLSGAADLAADQTLLDCHYDRGSHALFGHPAHGPGGSGDV